MTDRKPVDGAAPEVQAEFDRVWMTLDGLTRQMHELGISAARAGLVSPPEHNSLVALDHHFDARCDHLSKRVDELESKFAPDEVVDTLRRELASLDHLVCYAPEDAPPCLLDRVSALEASVSKTPPVVQQLAAKPCSCDEALELRAKLKEAERRRDEAVKLVSEWEESDRELRSDLRLLKDALRAVSRG